MHNATDRTVKFAQKGLVATNNAPDCHISAAAGFFFKPKKGEMQ